MELVGAQQQGPAGRKRVPNRDRPTAEDDALNQIAREAEARLAAKRAARAEAREIRMKELERQQKEIYQVQKKYYGLDTKFGDIEQWMEDSERYTHKSRRNTSASDEDERMSVGSRGSLRQTNGYEEDMYGSSQIRKPSRASCYSDLSLHCNDFPSHSQPSSQNGNRPSLLYSDALTARSYRQKIPLEQAYNSVHRGQHLHSADLYRASLYDENFNSENRRYSASSSRPPSEYSFYLGSGSRASSRASSARASPVVEERPEKDFDKGVRTVSSLSAATLASLGGTSSRRGSGDTSISVDTEASMREIKDIHELKDQIQDVEGKYMQGLKKMKDSLAEVEEKYKKAMVSNAQLDNEKTNFMYQVDTLKDALLELEEQLAESKRQYEEKNKDFEREKHAHAILQFQFMEVKEALKQREELLAALERQKEFFDSIRSERDDLREEVIVLKEQLKQHGIIPNSEGATNGEICSRLENDGLSHSSKIVPGASHISKVPGDCTLGRTNEVEMKNEILENVGKREILQNTEHEEHTEETKEQEIVQECSEIKTLADENAEAEKINEGKVSPTLLNSGLEKPDKSHSKHVPEIFYSLEKSDVVELRGERGSLGDTVEVEEYVGNKNVVNAVGNHNKVAGLGIESNQEIIMGIEILPQEQNKEKQTDIVVDETEGNNDEIFEEALDFVSNSHMATSSQLESPELMSNIEQNKIVKDDLDRQLDKDEGGIIITDKTEWGKNEVGGINEENEMANVVLQQEMDVVAFAVQLPGMPCTGEQKQVEIEEIQVLSSKHDAFVEEEQGEQEMETREDSVEDSPVKMADQREALFKALDPNFDSEKYEQNAIKEVHTEENDAEDDLSGCLNHEEKNVNLEDVSGETKSEFIDDCKALANIPKIHEEAADDIHEEDYNMTEVSDWPTEKQSVDKQDETIQESAITATVITEDVEKVSKGNEEEKNYGKTEGKVLKVLRDTEEAASLLSQKAEFSDHEKELDSEEAVEEYHEAFDFEESFSGEPEITKRSDNQGNLSENDIHQTQEKGGVEKGAEQNIVKEVYEKECEDKERIVKDKKEKTYHISPDEVVDDAVLTETENIQQWKGTEFGEDEHFQTASSVSSSSKAQCEILEDTNAAVLDQIYSKQMTESTSEQFAKHESSVDEGQEEALVGRKGKGKSREDCVIS
ncbi:leucine-rich repeat flightless-interacting protein 1 isoform X6 [Varanus komodoensis]|uniref:leucine-rich repeat flightless-interacting protein 1 isoform X6 n=1 Tax=Varanus komodoensis TaxID=61221 RepID=UPI001CF781A3|nr:leucine-rich repeat flightless-interacting protein 1 isoform X6 [Varanus komodoensis]